MADDKNVRNEQAENEEQRSREGKFQEGRDRADEAVAIRDDPGETLGDLDESLEKHDYPTTTEALIETFGEREVETQGGRTSIKEVLEPIDDELYVSADDVRNRIQGLIHR